MAKIFGQLERAQLENRTSDLAATITGAIWYRTDLLKAYVANGSTVRALLANDDKAVLGNSVTAADNIRLHRAAASLLQLVVGSDVTAEGTLSTTLAKISARVESYTTGTRPAVGNVGRIIWVTDTSEFQVDDGVTWQALQTGASSGGGASGLDSLMQKLTQEKYGIYSPELENAVGASFASAPAGTEYTGYALEDIASSDTSVPLVWNPVFLESADKDTDSAANWTAIEDSINLTTSATAKVGALALMFDKSNTGVDASIRLACPTTVYAAANTELRFWIDLPDLTNLSSLIVRAYDTTSNYREWTPTLNISGGALATGYQLIRVDLSNTSGSTTTGTGWVHTQGITHFAVGVRASSALQTYVNIRVDGVVLSMSNPDTTGLEKHQVTLFDNANKESTVLTTTIDRFVTLGAATTNAYNCGFVAADIAKLKRTTFANASGAAVMDSTYSGDVLDEQEVRISRILPASKDGTLKIRAHVSTPQSHVITAVGGGSVDVTDPTDFSADFVSGDVVEIHRPYYSSGKKFFEYVDSFAITGSSHSAGTTTINFTPTGVSVGDQLTKRHLSMFRSVVAKTANEAFSSVSIDESAAGIRLYDVGVPFQQINSVWGSWAIGAATNSLALENKQGPAIALSVTGSLNLQDEFMNGHFSASGFSNSNFLRISAAASEPISGDSADCTNLLISGWFKDNTGFTGTLRTIVSKFAGGSGFVIYANSGANYLQFTDDAGANLNVTGTFNVGDWNHFMLYVDEVTDDCFWVLNGVKSSEFAMTCGDLGGPFNVGAYSDGSGGATGMQIAAITIRRNLVKPTLNDIAKLYNGGVYQPEGFAPMLEYNVDVAGVSGQKVSLFASLARTTSAGQPALTSFGGVII